MGTFYSFKSVFHREVYLDVVKDRSHQQALTKLRISAHKLEIENGRYSKKSITDRLCKKCSQNKVEDETHFIVIARVINQKDINYLISSNKKLRILHL